MSRDIYLKSLLSIFIRFAKIQALEEYSLKFRSKAVVWIPIIGIAIIGLALFTPELLGFQLGLSYTEKTNVLLTFAIAMFAAVEGYSTYMQVELEHNKNVILDARNELEKVYGPLYTLLRVPIDVKKKTMELDGKEKMLLDEKFSTYPFMFPSIVYDLWQKKIRSLKHSSIHLDANDLVVGLYSIPLDFVSKINEEYVHRVKSLKKLLEKS